MRARVLLPFLLVLVLTQLGAAQWSCGRGAGPIKIVSPGPEVTSFSFAIAFELRGQRFGSPEAFLNGEPLVVSGGPEVFTASPSGGLLVEPGPPLLDENELVVIAHHEQNELVMEARHEFEYAPPKARAYRIEGDACPVSGPLAHRRVGDLCLENAEARFVVQDVTKPESPSDPTPRDMYSVGPFGGNIIDAVLVSNPTTDNFLEVQSLLNIETVANYQSILIVNDGQDGTPAIIRTCGPDDLLDFANPSSLLRDFGLDSPGCDPPTRDCTDDNDQAIEACTTYTLAPGDAYVRIDTEIFNNESVTLKPYVGDWLNTAGEVGGFFKPNPGIGEAIFGPNGPGMGWFAEPTIEGADRFEYGYVPVEQAQAPPVQVGSYVTVSGVTIILHDISAVFALLGFPSPFAVASGESETYTRYFVVGDGTANAAVELSNRINDKGTGTVQGCVTVGGTPTPSAKVTVGTLLDASGDIDQVLAHFVTDATGCYAGEVEVPTAAGVRYGAAAAKLGALYEGGTPVPPVTTFELHPAGDVEVLDFALPASGTLRVDVTDTTGSAVPARVTVVGFDPSPEPTRSGTNLPGFGSSTLGLFHDVNDRLPFGVVAFDYTGADGVSEFRIEPGTYHVFVSRGTEYSAWSTLLPPISGPVAISGGAVTRLEATIARVVDTPGFVSSDFHVHGIASPDSQVNDVNRANQFAGEGVENLVATDHHVHKDYLPAIAAAGLSQWVTSTVGEEITTFDYGHFNSYPVSIDPSVPSGGSTDWGVAAPPGRDFPQYDTYNLAPEGVYDLATTNAQSTPATTVQVNHIDSHFAPLKIDTSQVPPTDDLDADDRLARRLDPASPPLGEIFFPFPALELWNGYNLNHQSEFLDERIGIWTNLLDQDVPTTAIADTDTHTFRNLRTAGARSWTAASAWTDTPSSLDPAEVAASVVAGRAVGGQGIYVQTFLFADDGSGAVASLEHGGSTRVTSAGGDVTLEIRVQSPAWAEWDTLEIYSNAHGNVSAVVVDSAAPYLYAAEPLVTLSEGDCDPTTDDGDFVIEVVDDFPGIEGTERWQTTRRYSFSGLTADTWFVAVVKGTEGSCASMFPIFPADLDPDVNPTLPQLVDGNVGDGGVTALGFSNALYYEN
jgi:hypothetical protein